ncbi:peptidyl-prolyl cis-trans isomerase B (cyclophilin B) [Streptomyces sp. Amel2xB2]|uniref:peptidylprolyl isomerase n=1 Tax=Streptomyces sp. Amel2xB2 TaxID=1305829 RepID=UPI000DBA7B85|nr:peptidylprolyl isomerase [Streptomyces sp. Amel2xB2]RAJ60595.1 peptidyl-prolyl cis-trans isomerase B (cyclophilin B) [Streptomyces sp. Amel2xB2]
MVSSEQRRKQLAREKYQRQQARREERRRKARLRNIAIAAAVVLVIGAGAAYAASGGLGGEEEKAKKQSSSKDTFCDKPSKGEPNGKQWKKEPALDVDESATYAMDLKTTCGDIRFDMDAAKTPHTANSFRFLAGQKFFDHTKCHRLVDRTIHVLQCGDPKATGKGGPGYTLPDENLKDPRLKGGTYPAGTVAMANRYDAQSKKGRDTGGSQFFLVFEDSKLPPDYTPFGKITKGMGVLKKIADAGSTPDPQTQNTPPRANVVIERATVTKS